MLYLSPSSAATEERAAIPPAHIESSAPEVPQTAAKKKKPVADGKAIVEKKCATCHGLDIVYAKKRSKEQWRAVIASMQKKGSGLTEKEVVIVIDYLAKKK